MVDEVKFHIYVSIGSVAVFHSAVQTIEEIYLI